MMDKENRQKCSILDSNGNSLFYYKVTKDIHCINASTIALLKIKALCTNVH